MAGLLKYFKREVKHRCDKTDGLDTPDPDGPLSRDIPSSTIGIMNTCVRQVQQLREASSERPSRGPYNYFANTSTKVFYWKKSVIPALVLVTKHVDMIIYKHVPVQHGYAP